MHVEHLEGVIAAIPTPLDAAGAPDLERLTEYARYLLRNGCDGLNLLGTTGEATSLTTDQRRRVMREVASRGLPLERMMVGTGAAALADAVALTREAADLGFAGALLLPPFYYKPLKLEGLVEFVGAVVEATARTSLPLFLYNFPALSGIRYEPEWVAELVRRFGQRIAGLKDSSGDLAYARQVGQISATLRVFPSSEGVLLEARAGTFAGCISATANLNAPDCAAAYRQGDAAALARASRVRALFEGLPLVPGIKTLMARRLGEPSWARVIPPLCALTSAEATRLFERENDLLNDGGDAVSRSP
jgi:4-hydroxy-tetrahydrodipicolinate synthase